MERDNAKERAHSRAGVNFVRRDTSRAASARWALWDRIYDVFGICLY